MQILLDDMSLVYLTTFFCNIKHLSWSYENEFRCTAGVIVEGMPYISAVSRCYLGVLNFPDEVIKFSQNLLRFVVLIASNILPYTWYSFISLAPISSD